MTMTEATEIRERYDLYDSNFRVTQKRKDFRKASEWKTKRDALAAALQQAIAILKNREGDGFELD